MYKRNNNRKNGYTIVETMIAVSLFLVIVMAGMGALLNANLLHQKSRDMRSIMDNLSFVMEDMSRNLRTGSKYHCINDNNFAKNVIIVPKSCSIGGAIAFEEVHGLSSTPDDQWIYKIEAVDASSPFNIFRSTDGGATWVQLNPAEVEIQSSSTFSVLGAEPPSANKQQPLVGIRLVGKIKYKNVETPFSLQTSVSQRLIDI